MNPIILLLLSLAGAAMLGAWALTAWLKRQQRAQEHVCFRCHERGSTGMHLIPRTVPPTWVHDAHWTADDEMAWRAVLIERGETPEQEAENVDWLAHAVVDRLHETPDGATFAPSFRWAWVPKAVQKRVEELQRQEASK